LNFELEDIDILFNKDPDVDIREVLPSDTDEEVTDKLKKPFINKKQVIMTVILCKTLSFTITAKKNYTYDGATIPFGIGKGDTRLLLPALFHDIMCENKHIVFYNRQLSTMIFKKLLLMSKVSKGKSQRMYIAVELFQKFMDGWDDKSSKTIVLEGIKK